MKKGHRVGFGKQAKCGLNCQAKCVGIIRLSGTGGLQRGSRRHGSFS